LLLDGLAPQFLGAGDPSVVIEDVEAMEDEKLESEPKLVGTGDTGSGLAVCSPKT